MKNVNFRNGNVPENDILQNNKLLCDHLIKTISSFIYVAIYGDILWVYNTHYDTINYIYNTYFRFIIMLTIAGYFTIVHHIKSNSDQNQTKFFKFIEL